MEPIRARLFSFICLGDRRVGIQEVPKCEVADKIGSAGLEAVEVDEPSACLGIVSLEVTSAANAVLAEPFIAQSFKLGPDLVEGLEVTDLGHEVEDGLGQYALDRRRANVMNANEVVAETRCDTRRFLRGDSGPPWIMRVELYGNALWPSHRVARSLGHALAATPGDVRYCAGLRLGLMLTNRHSVVVGVHLNQRSPDRPPACSR